MTLHFLNEVANDAEWTQKSIIMSYSLVGRVNQLGELINRILIISSYQAQLRECMLNCSASLVIQQVFSKPCLVILISKALN